VKKPPAVSSDRGREHDNLLRRLSIMKKVTVRTIRRKERADEIIEDRVLRVGEALTELEVVLGGRLAEEPWRGLLADLRFSRARMLAMVLR
jgi:hypothetical protein